jgi:predicted O-methyltransferase YrrM
MSVHRETFTRLVKDHNYTCGVELGVDKGILFGMLLRECPQLHLTGVDLFPDRQRSRRAFESADTFKSRAELLVESTFTAHRHFPDGSLDFVFVDADHSEDPVRQDIANWLPKVRNHGGWFGGHDYSPKFPGVIAAVDEAFPVVQIWPGNIWGVFR